MAANDSDSGVREVVSGMASIQMDPSCDFRANRIFDFFDADKDGVLNYDELNSLQTATAGVALTKKQWKAVCGTFGINPNKSGLALAHILMTYQTKSANIEEDFQKVFPNDIPFSPQKSLVCRSGYFFSQPIEIVPSSSTHEVDIHTINPAKIINDNAVHTNYFVPKDSIDKFNKRWQTALRISFTSKGDTEVESQYNEWLSSGKSRGRSLSLQLMALPPNSCFKVHAHPNIEFEMTLLGTLHEARLCQPDNSPYLGKLPVDSNPSTEKSEPIQSIAGPDLNEISTNNPNMSIRQASVGANKFISNCAGSIHQTYTKEDGALILVLWSRCHAHIKPEQCDQLTCEGSALLKPGAGWA